LLPALRRESTSAPEGSIPEGLAIGNPDRIVEVIRKWESAGVDRINFLLNAVETVPQAEVLASMRLFAKEVMPKFAEKREAVPAGVAGGE
jgi:alkanesulfonate monooxygenase SsuD/methylene tetrahydromethanopterin reductase-like flavin-dependent oxidoreductase (luciferase family)